MDVNPYESPAEACTPIPKPDKGIVTDWFSLGALLLGTVAAVVVGFAIRSQRVSLGDLWLGWLLLGTTTAVGSIGVGGWVLGRFVRRMV